MRKTLKNLFGPEPPTSQDAAVRDALTAHGDSGERPRETTFYFYGGEFERLADAAREAGYQAHLMIKQDGAILTRVLPVDQESFDPISEQMEAWAKAYGCDYDGWETELTVKPN
ncbi:MAG TPA: ribonuclease E inhibitor RraB [Caulobacteraceae bacterium]|jgi:hypothetical protein